jgi:eukaryotic-like serine/threonine-protein kinase
MSIESAQRQLGRYVLYEEIASGGMATVHFARLHGAVGFSRVVAIKRLHPTLAADPHFVRMFLDEAHLAARVKHPNVVATIDVVRDESEVFLVMEHVLGQSLQRLLPNEGRAQIPASVVSSILCGILEGLHAAHEARSDTGAPLQIVHRDVSPHNVIVGIDGVARVFDFGIAKAQNVTQETREGVIKGKVTYMAPEQVRGSIDRRADVYAAGVILWELLAGRRLHEGERNDQLFLKLAMNDLPPPAPLAGSREDVPESLDAILARATAPLPEQRFATARDMALALEAAVPPAPAREVASWLEHVAGDRIARITEVVRSIERDAESSASIRAATASEACESMRGTAPGSVTRGAVSIEPGAEISLSTSLAPAATRRPWTMPAALLAFTAVLLVVGLRAARTSHGADDEATAQAAAAAATSPAGSLPPATAAAEAVETDGAEAESETSDAEETVATPRLEVAAAEPEPVVRRAVTTRTSPARAARPSAPPPPAPRPTPAAVQPSPPPAPTPRPVPQSKPSCESPFAVGADGIRQIKPECL